MGGWVQDRSKSSYIIKVWSLKELLPGYIEIPKKIAKFFWDHQSMQNHFLTKKNPYILQRGQFVPAGTICPGLGEFVPAGIICPRRSKFVPCWF